MIKHLTMMLQTDNYLMTKICYRSRHDFVTIFTVISLEVKFGQSLHIHMKVIKRKPDFRLCENKGADQLCSNCTADQLLCFCYSDSTIPLLLVAKLSSL